MGVDYTSTGYIKGTVDTGGVLHIKLNRPPVNAANGQFFFEIGHLAALAKTDADVRAIVISSFSDKYFTAGLDLKESGLNQSGSDPARKGLHIQEHIAGLQAAISQLETCDKPVIAAIAGIAYGLAVDLCCACDIRYAAKTARFSIKEVDVGLAADIGTLSRLPKIIGNDSLARELAYTARVFDAEEALKMGFVSRILDSYEATVDAALATARIIASKSPVAVLGTKHLLNYSRDHTTAESLHYTAIWNSLMLQTKDLEIAMSGALKKQKPTFAKL